MLVNSLMTALSCLLLPVAIASGETKITMDRNSNDEAGPAFKFQHVPPPSKNDSGTGAKFTVIDGDGDAAGGDLSRLNDGALPKEEDSPGDNFFFAAGTDGGRVLVDLNHAIEIKQVNTYSWHPSDRGPQVYELYASDGSSADFNAHPGNGKDPATCGWELKGKVDTRKLSDNAGGQYGVSVSDSSGTLGKYRYLLFVIHETENNDTFGNTFYSEVDIVGKDDPAPVASGPHDDSLNSITVMSTDGKCKITIQTSDDQALRDWAKDKLAPAMAEWYPKLVAMLPSPDFKPATNISVVIKPGRGVAETGGRRISANATWLKGEINRQATGSLIHEEVHVIQAYGGARRNNPNATRNPGWLVEGIADYIRFYRFEPEMHGADIRERAIANAHYDGSYRVTANFLNWTSEKYDKDLVVKLNAAMREGNYSKEIWKTSTGKTLEELGDEWKADLQKNVKPKQAS
jgi:hypothetical protein